MSRGEFSLIEKYFDRSPQRSDVDLAVGDDCAILTPPERDQLALSVDTLVAGVHFFADVCPKRLGHKALAVNLSDLAATGAEPLWCTLAITLPQIDELWLEAFSEGFLALAGKHQIDLVGGDTTQGPLSLTVQVIGKVPRGKALLRSGAQVGDLVYVSGPIGTAGLGLLGRQGHVDMTAPSDYDALEMPIPRIELGQRLRGIASACIDISDGLAQDLGHILQRSGVGAEIDCMKVPMSPSVEKYVTQTNNPTFPLTCGDDYELCFTAPPQHKATIQALFESLGLSGSCIGHISPSSGLSIKRDGEILALPNTGYEHFQKD